MSADTEIREWLGYIANDIEERMDSINTDLTRLWELDSERKKLRLEIRKKIRNLREDYEPLLKRFIGVTNLSESDMKAAQKQIDLIGKKISEQKEKEKS